MDDLKTLLDESVADQHPRQHSAELVRRTARTRQLRRRFGSAVVALTIGTLATSLVLRAFDEPPDDRSPGGLDLSSLAPAWTAVIPETNVFPEPIFTDSSIVVPTTNGIVVYPRTCADPCAPSWTYSSDEDAARGGPPIDVVQVAAGDGAVAITLEGRLAIFSEGCRDDGATCQPLWTATPGPDSNGYGSPLVHQGVVRVVDSESEGQNHHVFVVGFRLDCRSDGGECPPTWIGNMGEGTSYEPSAAVNGVFYKHVGEQMVGYTFDCARDGDRCAHDFQTDSRGSPRDGSGDLYGPLVRDGVVIVTAGTGELLAFPEHCGTKCTPLWIGRVSEWLDSWAMLAGEHAVIAVGETVSAFLIHCAPEAGLCRPAWETNLGGTASLAYADDVFVVASARVGESTEVVVLPADCKNPCQPISSLSFRGDTGAIASDGASLFVAKGHEITAYPLECEPGCEPAWTGRVPNQSRWMSVTPGGLIAASQSRSVEGIFGGVTLSAFQPT